LSRYAIFETDEFQKRLSGLPAPAVPFIRTKLDRYVYPQLRDEPHFGTHIKKLRGYVPDQWRYRIGRYRVFYGVDESERTVLMLSVDDRRDAYR
jgi:mRNA interferase RelE/StbE